MSGIPWYQATEMTISTIYFLTGNTVGLLITDSTWLKLAQIDPGYCAGGR